MTTDDKAVAIRRAQDALDLARRTRRSQGLAETIEDPEVLAKVARILRGQPGTQVA